MVVVGNAISRGNVELEHVLDQRIPFCSLPQILHDEFLRGKEVLVVAGTHGKTTTTSMLAWIFHSAGLQPSFLIGGIAENFGSSFQLGAGKALHPRRRRVRHRILRQRPEISALFSRRRDSDLGGIRSRRHLQRPRCGGDGLQAPGQPGAGPRTDRRAGHGREYRTLSGQSILSGRAIRKQPDGDLASYRICASIRLAHRGRCCAMASPGLISSFALAGEYNVLNATAAAALGVGLRNSERANCRRAEDFQEREAPAGSAGAGQRDHHHR